MVGRSLLVVVPFLVVAVVAVGQDAPPPPPTPLDAPAPAAGPATDKGVEVMARGPVHEAFASPATEPAPTKPIPKRPPAPLNEMPPEEKPEGNVTWISGYWSFDEDRQDFIWVSGTWRTPPPSKEWVAGYWKESGAEWQWAPGFWTNARKEGVNPAQAPAPVQENYLPTPPPAPEVAPPPPPPNVATNEVFYVPGVYVWNGSTYAWRAGYWARVQAGYVWVPAHYRWTPGGCVYIAGYWDLAVSRRGVLYAPVVVAPGMRVSYAYTPAYAVQDTLVLDTMFIRPAYCHYYFGDYYGPVYRERGFESCVVYSGRHYDAIFVYERARRPDWVSVQITLSNDRHLGRAPLPPRMMVRENIVINSNGRRTVATVGIAPAAQVIKASGSRVVVLDVKARQQVRQETIVRQQTTVTRIRTETVAPGARPGTVIKRPVAPVRPVPHPDRKPPAREPKDK